MEVLNLFLDELKSVFSFKAYQQALNQLAKGHLPFYSTRKSNEKQINELLANERKLEHFIEAPQPKAEVDKNPQMEIEYPVQKMATVKKAATFADNAECSSPALTLNIHAPHFIFMIPTTGTRTALEQIVLMVEQALGDKFEGTLILGLNGESEQQEALETIYARVQETIAIHRLQRLTVIVSQFTWMFHGTEKADVLVPYGQIRNKLMQRAQEHVDKVGIAEPILVVSDCDVTFNQETLRLSHTSNEQPGDFYQRDKHYLYKQRPQSVWANTTKHHNLF